jgi:hypothetical protein
MKKNIRRAVIEVSFIIFLFYCNLLMGEFERSGMELGGKNIFRRMTDTLFCARVANQPSRIAVYVQNSNRDWKAIIRGLLSPPKPTPSKPVERWCT